MGRIPESLKKNYAPGLPLYLRGKVRDTYILPKYRDVLVPVATDRVSIYDFVLRVEVPQKGEILTAMNVFWRTKVLAGIVRHDLLAYGSGMCDFLPPTLRENADLQKRGLLVRKLLMLPVEAIVRGYLTRSGLEAYRKTSEVCGHRLPPCLEDGSELPYPIFTPTTKAKEGHDEHMSADKVTAVYGTELERKSLRLYSIASRFARERGVILADTKLEFGRMFQGNELVLGDECFTPDSSRYWLFDAWNRARAEGKSPPPLDKQYVREKGKELGVNPKLDPTNDEHISFVHRVVFPKEVLERTSRLYRYLFWLLVGKKLEAFQRDEMEVRAELPRVKVWVVSGERTSSFLAETASQFGRNPAVELLLIRTNEQSAPSVLPACAPEIRDSGVVLCDEEHENLLRYHLKRMGKHPPFFSFRTREEFMEAGAEAVTREFLPE